ncbi:hypothetical protein D8S78_06685 [Natrialba swarupiae]|nr:hypothetical protein [Natrialba swarupiae]
MQCGDGTVWLYRLGSGRQRRRLARDRQEAGRLGSRVAHDLDGTRRERTDRHLRPPASTPAWANSP